MANFERDRRDRFLEHLRAARNEAGFTQAEVARQLGKPQSFVSKAETGERRLDFLEVETLAKLYGVELDYFRTLPRRRQ